MDSKSQRVSGPRFVEQVSICYDLSGGSSPNPVSTFLGQTVNDL